MSIIYDALQKTQRNREYLRLQNSLEQKKSPLAPRRDLKWMIAGGLILIVGVGVGTLFSFYGLPTGSLPKLTPVAKATPPATPPSAHFWISDSKKTAEPPISAPVVNQLAEAPIQVQVPPLALAGQSPVESKPATQPEPSPNESKLILNGVLISGLDKMALINNQPYHVGDVVNGMKIIEIELSNVKFQKGKELIELRVAV